MGIMVDFLKILSSSFFTISKLSQDWGIEKAYGSFEESLGVDKSCCGFLLEPISAESPMFFHESQCLLKTWCFHFPLKRVFWSFFCQLTIHFIDFSYMERQPSQPIEDLLADPAVDAVGRPKPGIEPVALHKDQDLFEVMGPFWSFFNEGKVERMWKECGKCGTSGKCGNTLTIWSSHVTIFSWSMELWGLQCVAGRCPLLLDRESHFGREARPEWDTFRTWDAGGVDGP